MIHQTESNDDASLREPDAWFCLAEAIFDEVLERLRHYDVEVHKNLRFVAGDSPFPYYEPSTLTIVFGVPDYREISGRLFWYYFQHLSGSKTLQKLQQGIEATLPLVIAHEVSHHLRHHYNCPNHNDFIEEQVANIIAVAFVMEHPLYRHTFTESAQWIERLAKSAEDMSPEIREIYPAFRIELEEVFVNQGILTSSELENARSLAKEAHMCDDEVLISMGVLSPGQILKARAERAQAEAYFNTRYMSNLIEYWVIGATWLVSYLAKKVLPSLGEALRRHITTRDWENSRKTEIRLFVERCLHGAELSLAVAAVDALVELEGKGAVEVLLSILGKGRREVKAAALRALCRIEGGTQKSLDTAKRLFEKDEALRAPASRLLRLAGIEPQIPHPGPEESAEIALASISKNNVDGYDRLEELLKGDRASVLAALNAFQEVPPGRLEIKVSEHLERGDFLIRRLAAKALGSSPASALNLAKRLVDDCRAVRQQSRESLKKLGKGALPALREVAETGSDAVKHEALSLACQIDCCEAGAHLEEFGLTMLDCARKMEYLEMRAAAYPELAQLTRLAGEERRRFANWSLSAFIQRRAPEKLELVRLAIESPDAGHRVTGRILAKRAAGRRGRVLARLLEEEPVRIIRGSLSKVLDVASGSRQAIVRAILACIVPRILAPEMAREFLQKLAFDSDPLVQAEAQGGLYYLDSRKGEIMLTSIEKMMFLRAIPAFAAVETHILRNLAEASVVEHFSTGEVLFSEGDPGNHLFVITKGRVAISAGGVKIREVKAQQFFGEMALFDGLPRSATVEALQNTTLLRLDRQDFYRLGRESPDLLIGVIQVLSNNLRRLSASIFCDTIE